jgi:hypothetical protein
MMTKAALVAGLALMAGVAVADRPSSFADSRGYQNCVKAASARMGDVSVRSKYFINEENEPGSRTYYLNGSQVTQRTNRFDGRVEAVRIACETTASGHRVLDVRVDGGQYAAIFRPAPGSAAN